MPSKSGINPMFGAGGSLTGGPKKENQMKNHEEGNKILLGRISHSHGDDKERAYPPGGKRTFPKAGNNSTPYFFGMKDGTKGA